LNRFCQGQNVTLPLQEYGSNEELLRTRLEKEKAKSKKVYGVLITALILCLLFGPQTALLYLLQTDSSLAPSLEVYFVDVGHGDAIFLRYDDLEIMIDTGPNTNKARHVSTATEKSPKVATENSPPINSTSSPFGSEVRYVIHGGTIHDTPPVQRGIDNKRDKPTDRS